MSKWLKKVNNPMNWASPPSPTPILQRGGQGSKRMCLRSLSWKVANDHESPSLSGHQTICSVLPPAVLGLAPAALGLPLSLSSPHYAWGLPRCLQRSLFPGLAPTAGLFRHHQAASSTAQSPGSAACLPASPVNELLISALGRHRRSLLLSTPAFVKL